MMLVTLHGDTRDLGESSYTIASPLNSPLPPITGVLYIAHQVWQASRSVTPNIPVTCQQPHSFHSYTTHLLLSTSSWGEEAAQKYAWKPEPWLARYTHRAKCRTGKLMAAFSQL